MVIKNAKKKLNIWDASIPHLSKLDRNGESSSKEYEKTRETKRDHTCIKKEKGRLNRFFFVSLKSA